MSRSASMSSFSPRRTVTWSSARRMRSRFVFSAMTRARTEVRRNVDSDEHGCALSWSRFDLDARAHERRALPHADEPESVALHVSIRVETDPVVLHNEQDGIVSSLEEHLDVPRARVFSGVVERFLRDSVQRRLDVRSEPLVEQTRCVQARGNVGAIGPVLNVVRQRGSEAEVVERCRAKLPREAIYVLIEAEGYCVEVIDLAGEARAVATHLLQTSDAESQGGEVLA